MYWIGNLLKYPTAEYNDTNCAFTVKGDLSIPTFREACRLLSLEYLPFCSTIKEEKGKPYFIPNVNNYLIPAECTVNNEDEVDALLLDLSGQAFDLQKEIPCRCFIIHAGSQLYLYFVFHHIIMDGHTLTLFFKRLSVIYDQLLEGKYEPCGQTDMLNRFNGQFEEMYSQCKKEDVKYWKEYMANIPLAIPVPHDEKEEQEEQDHRDYVYTFSLGCEMNRRVQAFCEEEKTTPFRLFASVWALTLSRAMQVEELLVDHTWNLRSKAYASLFGMVVNDLPIRFDFRKEGLTIHDVLDYVARNRQEEKKHPYAFYPDILRSLNEGKREREKGINVAINYPLPFYTLPLFFRKCETKFYKHIHVQLEADLILGIEDNKELTCELRYRSYTSLHFVYMLADVFVEMLKQVLELPNMKLKDIALLSVPKQKELVEKEERALHQAAFPQTVVERFRNVAREKPDQEAVVFSNKQLSYAELDRLSDAVAIALLERGLHQRCIGLSTPKNLEMMVGIWGILKSGNIYVPIDPEYPAERIEFMIKDCEIALVLTTLSTPTAPSSVPLARIEDLMGQERTGSLPIPSPSDIAYIIYTSGTTGKPKGIPVKHLALNQTAQTNLEMLELTAQSRVLQFANICFDASIPEIFPTFLSGATLVLPQEAMRKDWSLLLPLLEEQRISFFSIPPALLTVLPHASLPSLSTIIIGGDSTSQEAIDYWSEGRRFINAYGPAENCVDATYGLLHPGSHVNDIGETMPGVTCYVLDKQMHLVPDYMVGELYIGGVKLTDGYINRPELNAEKFVPNPFVSEEDKAKGVNLRLYKSGDLVMRREDGHLIFMGRSDYQVKLNGHRIELGEIEAKLMDFGSDIKDAVALVHAFGNRKELIAYVLVEAPDLYPVAKLTDYLQVCLPHYMVPMQIIPLKSFPYNVSGKVERKLLPAPEVATGLQAYEAPVTLTEKQIAKFWGQLLNIHFIDKNTPFQALGGDSIGIIQLAVKLHEAFGVAVKATDIYKHNTVAKLAAFVDAHLDNSDKQLEEKLVAIVRTVLGKALDAESDLFAQGMTDDQLALFVNRVATELNLFFTTFDVKEYRNIRTLLNRIDRNLYFWTEGHYTGKPIVVFMCGFVEYYPYNERIATFLEKDFSVFIIESFYQYFTGSKTVSLEELWRVYEDLFTVALKGREIVMLTGYCSGAEMAILFAQYMLKKYPKRKPFSLLNMEAIYDRNQYAKLYADVKEKTVQQRLAIFMDLFKDFPPLNYDGPIVHVMAGEPASLIIPEEGEFRTPEEKEIYLHAFQANLEAWQNHYPQAPFYTMPCHHLNFPEERILNILREIIQKHWSL